MASQKISRADRIRELSAINADVAVMLESAGKAVNSLTNNPVNKSANETADVEMADGGKSESIEERKEAFEEHSKAYYTTLQAVIARLRRQAYALEEAGILARDSSTLSSGTQKTQAGASGSSQRAPTGPAREPDTNPSTGLGNLDVGWLNSRGNKVGTEKENELVEDVKKLLEQSMSRERVPGGTNGV